MLKTRLLIGLSLLFSIPAQAYIGPGAGISVLGGLLGIITTVLVAMGAILFWPVRKMLKKKKKSDLAEAESPPGQDS